MKRVVSVSLGSSRRDHRVEAQILGEDFIIERRGTDGDLERAIAMIGELDGHVDAIGLGGVDLYLVSAGRRYMLRDARRMLEAAKRTPVVDGTGLKNTLERRTVAWLDDNGVIDFEGKDILLVSALDRYGMAEEMLSRGGRLILGDAMFGLGLPLPIYSLRTLGAILWVLSPIICRLPMSVIYPTGKKQDEITPRFGRFYRDADIIAGDLHFIRRHMPDDLSEKIIITNTVTSDNELEFRQRRVSMLVTTTPKMEGRSFGTNVMEGVLVALAGKHPDELEEGKYEELLEKMDLVPRVEILDRE
ncbi:MAG: quinate 5-dehydrogenase [Bacillota bacterium]